MLSNTKPLTPLEQWMVKSNLKTIATGQDPQTILNTLRNNGFNRIASSVEQILKTNCTKN